MEGEVQMQAHVAQDTEELSATGRWIQTWFLFTVAWIISLQSFLIRTKVSSDRKKELCNTQKHFDFTSF